MTRGEAWFNHASNVLVAGTGVVYGWMLYLLEPDDPFALANHPLQPLLHASHVVTAPLLVLGVGLLWRRHVWARVAAGFRPRRRTGLVLFLLFPPMVASGYLLQVSVEEAWRTAWTWTHVATSVLWLFAYGIHQLAPRPPRGASGEPEGG